MWRPGRNWKFAPGLAASGIQAGRFFKLGGQGASPCSLPPCKGISKTLTLIPRNIIKSWKYTWYPIFHLLKHIYHSKITFFLPAYLTLSDHGAVFDFCRDFLGSRRELYSFRNIFSSKNVFFPFTLSSIRFPKVPRGFSAVLRSGYSVWFQVFSTIQHFSKFEFGKCFAKPNSNTYQR